MTAALLAAGAALCYGISNFVGPRIVRNLPLYPVLISGQVVALVVSAALLVTESGTPSGRQVVAALLAGLGNAFALIAFYRAVELGPMSIVAPLGALGAVVPVLLGAAQGESIGPVKLFAIALALAGVALAARPSAEERAAGWGDRRAAAVWALLSSLGFGVFLAGMSEAAGGGPFWAIALSRVSLLALYVVVAVRLASPLRVAVGDVPRVMVPGLLLFAGTLLYTVATREGDLSVVSVIASLAPVVIVALAFTILGERLTRTQAVGAAAAIAGSVILAAR